MSRDSGARPLWWRHLEPGFLLILASCSQLPPTSTPTVGWLVFEHLVTWAEAEPVQEGWREQCRTRTTEFCRTP